MSATYFDLASALYKIAFRAKNGKSIEWLPQGPEIRLDSQLYPESEYTLTHVIGLDREIAQVFPE